MARLPSVWDSPTPAILNGDTAHAVWKKQTRMAAIRTMINKIDAKARAEALRYLCVVLVGSVIDLSIAWTAYKVLGAPIVGAAALGYVVATILSYFAHEFWTFRGAGSAFSPTRLGKFTMAAVVTLSARLSAVWLAAPLEALPFGALLRLLFGFGVSLTVGFVINRLLVFERKTPR